MNLRIISGEFKGRFISAPNSKFTRPTTDRVRETLFNLLANIFDFTDKNILDLYSGSGSLGFECLSRGAGSVHFIEKNFQVYSNLLNNTVKLGVNNKVKIIKTYAKKWTSNSSKIDAQLQKEYDLIIADPPFFEFDIYDVVKNIYANSLLKKDGLMIIERSIQTKQKDVENFGILPFKIIGDACLYKFNYT